MINALCGAVVHRQNGRALLCEKPRGHGGFHFYRWVDDPRIERDRDYTAELDAEARAEETR